MLVSCSRFMPSLVFVAFAFFGFILVLKLGQERAFHICRSFAVGMEVTQVIFLLPTS